MAISDGSDSGFGTAITFQSGLLAKIIELNGESIDSRQALTLVHMALVNGRKRKIPSDVIEPGRWKVKIAFETDKLAAYKTARTAASETVTVTFPIPVSGGLTAGTWASTGFATDMGLAIPAEDFMTADMTIELTGEPTMVNAA